MKSIILASNSPRRKVLLEIAGVPFIVEKSPYEEPAHTDEDPYEFVKQLAYPKTLNLSKIHPDAIVIGADTTIVCDGIVCEKPGTPERAKEMLRLLSGKKHAVITGYAIIDLNRGMNAADVETSYVWFKKLSDKNIDWYVATGEPLDKAGAYAIQEQGKKFIEKVEGDYDNVVGLPVKKVLETLRTKFSIKPLE